MKRLLLALVWLLLASSVYAQPQPVLTPPSYASLPATCRVGSLVTKTTATAGLYVCSATNTWTIVSSGTASGAPADATYITQTANSTLTAEQALGALSTGLMNSTTTTGVVSTLAPTDDNTVVGSGTAWALKALPSCSTASSALNYNTTTNAFGCNTISGTFSGSIASGQVAVGSGTDTIGGSSSLTFNGTNFFPPNESALLQTGLDFYSKIPDSLANGSLLTPALAGAGAGNLSNGVYSYCFAMAGYNPVMDDYSNGQTACGSVTPSVTVTDHAANGQVTVQKPFTCDEGSSESVWIYRTTAGGTTYKLVNSGGPDIACGRTFTDNVADVDLGATAPTTNTTLARRWAQANSDLSLLKGDGFNSAVINLVDTSGNTTVRLQGQSSQAAGSVGYPSNHGTDIQIVAGRGQGTDSTAGSIEISSGTCFACTTRGFALISGTPLTLDSVTYISMTGDARLSNGKALQGDTTIAHTWLLQGYDTDTGPGYVTFGTVTNGTAPSFVLAPPAGGATVSVTARHIASGATPAVTDTSADSCGSGTQTIVGNDNAGKVTVIGSSGTSCTVTFATAFANAPSCSATNETTAALARATTTTSTVILAGVFLQDDVIAYTCIGR